MSAKALYPPGPRFSPIGLGALRLMRNPYTTLLDVARKYGDIALIRIGPMKVCLLNHPRYVKEVLVTHYRDFIKGGAFYLARSVLGEGLLTSDGDFHLRQRRLAQPAFSPQRISTYALTMIDCARRVRDRWRDGQTFDIFPDMSHTTLTIAAETLFGVGIENRTDDVREAMTEVIHNWRRRALPLAHLLQRLGIPFPANRGLRKARERLDAILYEIIARKRAAGVAGNDLLSMLVHAVEDGARMSDLQLRDEAMTFMLAGHETMATALTWMWYLLGEHPDVSRRFYAEIDAVLGDREPTPEDLPNLSYVRKVFNETIRLYPPLWNFTRLALREVPLGPYVIPRGCEVMVCPYILHRNPQFFPDPLRFDPDRSGPSTGRDPSDLTYFPFSGGVRRCIGEPFAWAEGVLVAATLAQRWKLELVPGQVIEPARAFIARPKHGVRVRLVERRPVARRDTGPSPAAVGAAP
jgi:cytochrome P450